MAKDYLALPDAEFERFYKYMNQYVDGKCTGSTPEWTHIPQIARTEMADAYAAWNVAYGRTIGPHTPVDTEAKNDAKDAAKK
ncbi:MAG: hypothetical protein LBB61_06615, partial [Treponema sp.]|nr:hypothetical protein [Treponema sp.]